MDRNEQLWLGRGETLGRLLSESRRAPADPVTRRPAEPRPAVDPFADPLEAARFSASIALAMRNGAMDKAKEARAEAMRAAFRWVACNVKRWFSARPLAAPMPAPVRQGFRNTRQPNSQ